ncbi:MAG: type II toxin-antitoxin system HipA family toxin [Alphaproteobacteria bacterium]|nr:type II toxin-antitoxin system HipA family toxin [Alphaproteobacteria bacterium]
MKAALSVWWEDKIVGALRLDEHGDVSFAYDPAWLADASAAPLSASLPKRAETLNRRACRPFFAGLLPEEAPREAVARALGLSKGNDFALLRALGGDVAGALTLWPEGEQPPTAGGNAPPEPLGENALVALLDELPKRPFLAGREGLRLSLAGAQNKIPVVLVDGAIALPAPGQPTTHILKPPIERFPGTTENEAFAMALAAELGLVAAPAEARVVADRHFLLVTRYDRARDAAGRVTRLHQEDFCQALGIPPENKYAAEGGPTFKTSFELLRRVATRPAVEVLKLLDAAIFNLIVGNADAHGKNYSLLYGPDGATLAPLYDLLSTVAYPELSPKLSMKIGKSATLEEVDDTTWAKFAGDAGLAAPFVRRRVKELAAAAAEQALRGPGKIVTSGLSEAELKRFSTLVAARAVRMR